MTPMERLGWDVTDAGIRANVPPTNGREDEMDSLDNILDDSKPAEKETPEPEKEAESTGSGQSSRKAFQEKEAAAQAEGAGKVRDPVTGQFVAKPEPEKIAKEPEKQVEKPAGPDVNAQLRAAIAQANDERRKRQELAQQLEQFKQQQSPPKAEESKTFWEDPEGSLAKWQADLKERQSEIQRTAVNTKLDVAEFLSRSKHPDFDEKIGVFTEVLQQTPGLYSQWLGSRDPAEFAYKLGESHLRLKQAGSLDSLKEQIEKETRIKVEAEIKAKLEAEAKQRAAIPGSLTDAHSSGINKPTWGGPTSLDSILKP